MKVKATTRIEEPYVVPAFSRNLMIHVDLQGHAELYDKIHEIAARELRSVNNQIIYWLLNNIDHYMGFEKGEKKK